VRDQHCTVISQSFHHGSEPSGSGLQADDLLKDWLALHWPYPTILQAAGNYWLGDDDHITPPSDEYVNHKGYNSLAVGNHDDTASAMAGDSVFRNPSSNAWRSRATGDRGQWHGSVGRWGVDVWHQLRGTGRRRRDSDPPGRRWRALFMAGRLSGQSSSLRPPETSRAEPGGQTSSGASTRRMGPGRSTPWLASSSLTASLARRPCNSPRLGRRHAVVGRDRPRPARNVPIPDHGSGIDPVSDREGGPCLG
jgi:hypothetical protein